jgi:hypothetical protein
MSILGGITRPMQNVAQNAAKAGKITKIKLKVKVKPTTEKEKPGADKN